MLFFEVGNEHKDIQPCTGEKKKKNYVAEVWALQRTYSAVRLTSAAVWSLVSSRDM